MLLRAPPAGKSKGKEKMAPDQNLNEQILSVTELTKCHKVKERNLENSVMIDQDYKEAINKAFVIDETFEYAQNNASSLTTTKADISKISFSVGEKESQVIAQKGEPTNSKEQGYKIIMTNLAFIRLLMMSGLAAFSAYSMLFILPPLAMEWGASDVTASLTVTVGGATELVTR